MDAFWTENLGKIIAIGVVGGSVGYFLLYWGAKLIKLTDSTSEKITRYGGIICAIIAIIWLAPAYQAEINKQAIKTVDANITKMIIEAKPVDGKSALEVFSENAEKISNDRIASISDREKKLYMASSQFLGFYLGNTKSRPEYCSSLGVAIPRFVSEFEKVNQRELISARKIQTSSHGPNIEKSFQTMEALGLKIITLQMTDWASQMKISGKELCQIFESNPIENAARLRYSELMPLQSQLLIDTNP